MLRSMCCFRPWRAMPPQTIPCLVASLMRSLDCCSYFEMSRSNDSISHARSVSSCSPNRLFSRDCNLMLHFLFLIEVLVDRLIDFFVSGSSVTKQTLFNSALAAKRSCPGSTLLRYHVCRVSALYGDILCCAVVVVMSHPQPSLSCTGVLWVSTGTHRCVDPHRQGGGSTMRQLAHCVDCGCRA